MLGSKLKPRGYGSFFFFFINSGSRLSPHYYCTTAASAACPTRIPSLVDCLINSLGFSKGEAISIIAKVRPFNPRRNPELVINFLKQTGMDQTQIKKIVSIAPRLLSFDVSKTLNPKIQCFREIGLSGSDLGSIIAGDGLILSRGLDTQLKPNLDILRRVLGSDQNVVKALQRSSWLLTVKRTILERNLLLLRNFGFSNERISKFIVRRPRHIISSTRWLEETMRTVEKDFGIPRNSTMFLYVVDAFLSISKRNLDKKLSVFRSFGWSDSDILTMVQKQPDCVNISEERLRNMLNFFTKELNYESSYLATHPRFFCCSLDRRVIPRNEILHIIGENQQRNTKKLNLNLYNVLLLSEEKFLKNYVLPYKDKLPELYKIYIKSKKE